MAEKYPYKVVGERIRAARKAAGLTQQGLADELGVSRETVTKWQTGEVRPERFYGPLSEKLGLDPTEIRLLGDVAQAREAVAKTRERLEALEAELASHLADSRRLEARRARR